MFNCRNAELYRCFLALRGQSEQLTYARAAAPNPWLKPAPQRQHACCWCHHGAASRFAFLVSRCSARPVFLILVWRRSATHRLKARAAAPGPVPRQRPRPFDLAWGIYIESSSSRAKEREIQEKGGRRKSLKRKVIALHIFRLCAWRDYLAEDNFFQKGLFLFQISYLLCLSDNG